MKDFKRLRQAIAADAAGSDGIALAIMVCDSALYAAALFGFCALAGPLRFVALAVGSIMAGVLFLVGHDASHRSLAKSGWLNACIARLAFMPTLHPETAWNIGHNQRHHGFTNLRGVDHVWAPWSRREYDAASPRQRWFYRFYRTPAGIWFYYPIELWWGHVWNSDPLDRSYAGNHRMFADKVIALGGFSAIYAGWTAVCLHLGQSALVADFTALTAVVVPFFVYQFLMSVFIFLHHTHPRIRWFTSRETYDPLVVYMQNTIHMRFPKVVEIVLHEIFQHTAHHVNPRVPLYRLERAQRTIERLHGDKVIQETFSPALLLWLLRECQLYDFETNRWLKIADGEQVRMRPSA